MKNNENEVKIYTNDDKQCECWKCELNNTCQFKDKYLRLTRQDGGLGLCKKLS